MKFIIQPPPERKEYVNLPAREPDDLARQYLGAEKAGKAKERELLGKPKQQTPEEESAQPPLNKRDVLADFLSDKEHEEQPVAEGEETSWKHTRWGGVLFLAVIGLLGAIWYMASRSEKALPLALVKVEGAKLLTSEEVLTLAAIDRSQPFYKIDLKPIEQRLLRHSFIRHAHVRRESNPETLVLSIEERQPIAMLRSDVSGETYIIDADGLLLRPKLIAGLRDPARLLQVPLLSGVNERDTAGYRAMAQMVSMISSLDSGALRSAVGELHRTPTGAYVIYTTETQTPIFIGSPFDKPFKTAIEEQTQSAAEKAKEASTPLFNRQLALLAKLWKSKLQPQLRTGGTLYVDARFKDQIILKPKGNRTAALAAPASHTTADAMIRSLRQRASLFNTTRYYLACNEPE